MKRDSETPETAPAVPPLAVWMCHSLAVRDWAGTARTLTFVAGMKECGLTKEGNLFSFISFSVSFLVPTVPFFQNCFLAFYFFHFVFFVS